MYLQKIEHLDCLCYGLFNDLRLGLVGNNYMGRLYMKRTIMSALLILFMAVSMLIPIGAQPQEAKAAASFTIRTSMPKLTDKNAKWYFSDINRFWAAGRLAPDFKKYKGIMDDGVTSGYVWGNCTWWAYSRASEVMGEPLNPGVRGNAGAWYSANKQGNYYPYGSTPKVGAIVVYRTHVAFIEKIVNGQIYVSESGWQTKTYGPSSTDDFFFHYGIPWNRNEKPQGYIYVTDKKSTAEETVKVDYSVKVDVTDLRMRSGPGTGYSVMGKIEKGIHKLEATTEDGEWGKLASNGYWISLDYATKISSSGSSKSTNNKLKSLSVSGYKLSPSFKDSKTTYSLTVPSDDTAVTIKASKDHKDAKVTGTGKVTLKAGLNTKKVVVTAESGAKKTYTLKITRSRSSKVQVEVSQLNMRSGPGTSYTSKGHIKKGTYTITMTQDGWGKLYDNGYWIKLSYTKAVSDKNDDKDDDKDKDDNKDKDDDKDTSKAYKVKVDVDSLNMRTGPGTNYTSKGKIKKGTYTITKTSNGWGKLKTNGYWIKLSYTKVASESSSTSSEKNTYKVKVTVDSLNMRSGPSTAYTSKGKIKKGTYTVMQTKNGWGKLKENGYWIDLSYTKKVK